MCIVDFSRKINKIKLVKKGGTMKKKKSLFFYLFLLPGFILGLVLLIIGGFLLQSKAFRDANGSSSYWRKRNNLVRV